MNTWNVNGMWGCEGMVVPKKNPEIGRFLIFLVCIIYIYIYIVWVWVCICVCECVFSWSVFLVDAWHKPLAKTARFSGFMHRNALHRCLVEKFLFPFLLPEHLVITIMGNAACKSLTFKLKTPICKGSEM